MERSCQSDQFPSVCLRLADVLEDRFTPCWSNFFRKPDSQLHTTTQSNSKQ